MTRKSQHVVPASKGGWNVKKSGASRATRHFTNKEDAIKFGREVSKNSRTELYIHKKDGTIFKKATYDNNSFLSRDEK